jgi:thiamine pyrophosphokinase
MSFDRYSYSPPLRRAVLLFQRVLAFANGIVPNDAALRKMIRSGDRLIAVDGGLNHIKRLGLQPHVLIGDLDSVDPADVTRLEQQGVRVIRYPVQKDETDLELALLFAADEGARSIVIAAGLGGRIDQTLGNLGMLADPRFSQLDLRLDDGVDEITLIRQAAHIAGTPGDVVSLIPFTAQAEGVTTVRLQYPLKGETLYPYRTRGISNVMLATSAEVSLTDGALICIHTRQAPVGSNI